jgi:hypothetical protein
LLSAASVWLVSLFALPVPCRADFIAYYQTAPGAVNPSDGQPVHARAMFEANGTTLTITLTNLQADPKAVSQNLSDVFFTLTTGETAGELVSSSADFIAVSDDHTFTPAGSGSTGWILRTDVSGGLALDLLGTGDAPTHTIIGPPAPDSTYSAAKGSIAGNDPHNPFIDQTATFVLNVPVSEETRIDRVVFSFGTAAGEDVPGDPGTPVPEPGSLFLLGTGLCAAGLAAWRSRK